MVLIESSKKSLKFILKMTILLWDDRPSSLSKPRYRHNASLHISVTDTARKLTPSYSTLTLAVTYR